MKQFTHRVEVATRGKGLYAITREIEGWAKAQGLRTGLLTVFIQHTSASLTIQENADPDVVRDLNEFFERLAPENADCTGTPSRAPTTCRRTSARRSRTRS